MKQMIMMKRARTRTARTKQVASKSNLSENSQGDNMHGNARANFKISYERYMALAKEALLIGDRIRAESYFQQAEHYLRSANESKSNGYKSKEPVEYRDNVYLMSQPAMSVVPQEIMPPANDFEKSIEEELSLAEQTNV